MTYTVQQAATAVNLSVTTVRTWTRDFAEFLSDQAAPAPGEVRFYTDADMAVFQTIAVMRAQRRPFDEIRRTLASGERYEPTEAPRKPASRSKTGQEGETTLPAPLELVERFLVRYERRIDSLEQELASERAARIEAERAAARLAGQLEAQQAQAERPSLWRRLFG
jgi:DNA-binding transcriptional MerR regulator